MDQSVVMLVQSIGLEPGGGVHWVGEAAEEDGGKLCSPEEQGRSKDFSLIC